MYLSNTTEKLQVVLGATVASIQLQFNCSYQDITSAGMTLPQSSSQGSTNNTTDVDMVTAPAASTTRQITIINIYNNDTASATVTVKKDVSGTDTILYKGLLLAGDSLFWSREVGWKIISGTAQASHTFDVFTANGTWTKPSGLKGAFVFCAGAGGGGGSGARNAAGTNRFGGSGGGGGACTWRYLTANELTSTVSVTVGVGGTGAAGVAVDTTNGTAGGAGTNTDFGGLVIASAGSGGPAGATTQPSSGSGGGASTGNPTYGPYSLNGASGGGGTTTSTSFGQTGFSGSLSTPGSGGGAGISSANVAATVGGTGGGVYENGVIQTGPSSGASPNGANNKSRFLHFSSSLTSGTGIGTGGAGGYPSVGTYNGGNGGYGAGGGGGSGSLNGTTSGAGGNGGGGLCIVMNIF